MEIERKPIPSHISRRIKLTFPENIRKYPENIRKIPKYLYSFQHLKLAVALASISDPILSVHLLPDSDLFPSFPPQTRCLTELIIRAFKEILLYLIRTTSEVRLTFHTSFSKLSRTFSVACWQEINLRNRFAIFHWSQDCRPHSSLL